MTEQEAQDFLRAELIAFWSRAGIVLAILIVLAFLLRRRISRAVDRLLVWLELEEG